MIAAVNIAFDVAATLTAVSAFVTAVAVLWSKAKHRLGSIEHDVKVVEQEVRTGNGSTNGEYAVRIMHALEDVHGDVESLREDVRSLAAAVLAHVTDHKLH